MSSFAMPAAPMSMSGTMDVPDVDTIKPASSPLDAGQADRARMYALNPGAPQTFTPFDRGAAAAPTGYQGQYGEQTGAQAGAQAANRFLTETPSIGGARAVQMGTAVAMAPNAVADRTRLNQSAADVRAASAPLDQLNAARDKGTLDQNGLPRTYAPLPTGTVIDRESGNMHMDHTLPMGSYDGLNQPVQRVNAMAPGHTWEQRHALMESDATAYAAVVRFARQGNPMAQRLLEENEAKRDFAARQQQADLEGERRYPGRALGRAADTKDNNDSHSKLLDRRGNLIDAQTNQVNQAAEARHDDNLRKAGYNEARIAALKRQSEHMDQIERHWKEQDQYKEANTTEQQARRAFAHNREGALEHHKALIGVLASLTGPDGQPNAEGLKVNDPADHPTWTKYQEAQKRAAEAEKAVEDIYQRVTTKGVRDFLPTMPPGAVAKADGQPDGTTGMLNGKKVISRGGFAFPVE